MPITLSCGPYYGCDYDAILSMLEEMQCRIDLGMEYRTLLDGDYLKIQQVNHGELFRWRNNNNKDGDGRMTNEQALEVTMSMESTSTT